MNSKDSTQTSLAPASPAPLGITFFDGDETDCIPHGNPQTFPTWDAFCSHIRASAAHAPGAVKGGRGYFTGCSFYFADDDALLEINRQRARRKVTPLQQTEVARARDYGYRVKILVDEVSALVVDYDERPTEQPDWRAESWPGETFAYSSHKYDPEREPGRWRAIIRLAEVLPHEFYDRVKQLLESRLPPGAVIRWAGQPAFLPTCPLGRDVAFAVVPGAALDWRALLASAPRATANDVQREPVTTSETQRTEHDPEIVKCLAGVWLKECEGHFAWAALGGWLYREGVSEERAKWLAGALADAVYTSHDDPEERALEEYNGAEHKMGLNRLKTQLLKNASSASVTYVIDTVEKLIKKSVLPVVTKSLEASNDNDRPTANAGDEKRADLGNARRLVRMHGADLRYFMARKRWLTWDGSRWRADDTGEIARRAKSAAESLWQEAKSEPDDEKRKVAFQWAAQCQNQGRITAMIALAESEPGIPVRAIDLDSDPWLLNVVNGTLDLRTGELSPPERSKLMTKVCAVSYTPGARSELWDGFVADLFGDDHALRDYVQRAMGYALFGAWREKRFWFGYGPPDGGKSTLLGVTSDVLGDYAVNADASTWMLQTSNGGTRGDVVRLLGARLVTTLEVRASARFDQQLMKKVTGGDMITARQLYENDIEFAPTFSLWFGANDRPIIPDDDEGFWNRVACVPFTRVVPKERQDKALREKLTGPEHAPAVLAWLVAGCLEWQRQGLGSCEAVAGATAAYKRDMNQAARFFDECCEKGDGFSVSAPELRTTYDEWCRSDGVKNPLNGKAFGARIRALGATGNDDETRVKGLRTWFGIRLRAAN